MSDQKVKNYFQNHMPGNICYGCGADNQDGLQIKSYWQDDIATCVWHSEPKYQGWQNLTHGGILACLIDCHCMCTAMAHAVRSEHRELGSQPFYKYATASMNIQYLKPTINTEPIELQAKVIEQTGRKSKIQCDIFSKNELTVTAEVLAIRVVDSGISSDKSVWK